MTDLTCGTRSTIYTRQRYLPAANPARLGSAAALKALSPPPLLSMELDSLVASCSLKSVGLKQPRRTVTPLCERSLP